MPTNVVNIAKSLNRILRRSQRRLGAMRDGLGFNELNSGSTRLGVGR